VISAPSQKAVGPRQCVETLPETGQMGKIGG
jgi:hypothetical protein